MKPNRGWFLSGSFHFSFPACRTSKLTTWHTVPLPCADTKAERASWTMRLDWLALTAVKKLPACRECLDPRPPPQKKERKKRSNVVFLQICKKHGNDSKTDTHSHRRSPGQARLQPAEKGFCHSRAVLVCQILPNAEKGFCHSRALILCQMRQSEGVAYHNLSLP